MNRASYTTSSDHFEYLSVPNSANIAALGIKSRKPSTLSHLELHNRLYAQHHHHHSTSKLASSNKQLLSTATKALSKPSTPYTTTGSRPPTVSNISHLHQHHHHPQSQNNQQSNINNRTITSASPPPQLSSPISPPLLTEENLKLHTKLSKNQPMSYVERISIWRQSLPEKFEDVQDTKDSIRRSSSAAASVLKHSTPTTSATGPVKPIGSASGRYFQQELKRPTTTNTITSSTGAAMMSGTGGGGSSSSRAGLGGSAQTLQQHQHQHSSKKRHEERGGSGSLFRPLPSLPATPATGTTLPAEHQDPMKGSQSSVSQNMANSSSGGTGNAVLLRGKLLCCLKVEIKTGVFRMLPVHENDNAHELSFEFCKTNNLLNSVEALTNHVTLSMSTFSANK